MNFISASPSLPLRIPSSPTPRVEKGHTGAFQTFSLWRWGGNGLAVRQNSHSCSLTTPVKDRGCHPVICNRYPASPRRKIASAAGHGKRGSHGADTQIAQTLATKRSYDSQDHFGRYPVFEGKKTGTGEKGGRQVARGALVVGMSNTDHYQCT
jgi:hypothetical protein